MPIFRIPKRRSSSPNADTKIVGGKKFPASEEGEPKVLSSAQTKSRPVQIQSKHDTEEISVQSHKRSRPRRQK
jgi:hypothetical protein